jgi:hypothetical protein
MTQPKPTCSAPKPAAIQASPQAAGVASAAAPSAMKPIPISGIARTEKVPAVTTAAP